MSSTASPSSPISRVRRARNECNPLYITERERGLVDSRRVLGAVDQLPLQVVGVSRSTVLAAAHVKARFPIAYADAFAVVAAQDHQAVVMTGDPEFQPLVEAGLISVAWLPRRRS